MRDVVALLETLNRKERYFLVAQALGNRDFTLDAEFRAALEDAVDVKIPASAFVAMDYHFDWIASAITFADQDADRLPNTWKESAQVRLMTGNQEDVDLLVAFSEGGVTHLTMLEAKFDSGWTNKQMQSKAARLRTLFGEDGDECTGIRPHFVLISPWEPQRITSSEWPRWMLRDGKPRWLELEIPAFRSRVQRTDANGRANRDGTWVSIKPVRVPRDRRFEWHDGDIVFDPPEGDVQ